MNGCNCLCWTSTHPVECVGTIGSDWNIIGTTNTVNTINEQTNIEMSGSDISVTVKYWCEWL